MPSSRQGPAGPRPAGNNTEAAHTITTRPAALEGGRQQHKGGACHHLGMAGRPEAAGNNTEAARTIS